MKTENGATTMNTKLKRILLVDDIYISGVSIRAA
jgi:pyrimidine operon attenuation protein/uracil phosphoribosyltransferase